MKIICWFKGHRWAEPLPFGAKFRHCERCLTCQVQFGLLDKWYPVNRQRYEDFLKDAEFLRELTGPLMP